MRHRFLLVLCVVGSLFIEVKGQSQVSPYSSYGLGEITPISFAHNVGMGDVGIGMPIGYFINVQNPAWLRYNYFSTFQVGLKSDYRTFNGAGNSLTDNTGSIEYISISLPIMSGKWSSNLGLSPFSSVNYNIANQENIEGTTELAVNEFSGSGGLTQLYWSNGFKVYKGLNIGISASYIFGTLDRTVKNIIVNDTSVVSLYRAELENLDTYSDLTFSIGLGHRVNLEENKLLNYGVVYKMGADLQGTRDVTLRRLNSTDDLVQTQLIQDGVSISAEVPQEFGAGFSYEFVNKYQIGLDAAYALWEDVNGLNVNTKNSLRISIGGNIIPDYKSVDSYFKRVIYRAGFSYKELPYVINGTEINDFGINFGASFPLKGSSSIDSGFKFGQRGTDTNNLVRETYFQIVFGVTFNDRWFIKRRYD